MATKLRAFTLVEVTIVMILSGICVAICFSVFNMSSSSFRLQKDNGNFVNEFQSFRYMFQRDLDYNATVTVEQDQIVIRNTDNLTIRYKIKADQIVRNAVARTDTFNLSVSDVQSQPFVLNETPFPLAASISMNIMCKKRPVRIAFYMQYDAAFLLNKTNLGEL